MPRQPECFDAAMRQALTAGTPSSSMGESGSDESAAEDDLGLDAILGYDLLATALPALLAGGATSMQATALARSLLAATGNAALGASLLEATAPAANATPLPPVGGGATTTSGGASSRATIDNARTVAERAAAHGVNPVLAVAMMLVESGGDNRAVGDGGTSFGLFQLHEGGMLTSAGLAPQEAFDPAVNADVALRSLAKTIKSNPQGDPGALAAASQRPADAAGYAIKVNAAFGRAQSLLQA